MSPGFIGQFHGVIKTADTDGFHQDARIGRMVTKRAVELKNLELPAGSS